MKKQPEEIKRFAECPCCNGKGQRRDMVTKIIRQCVACKGQGLVKLYYEPH
jgi:DnaJ-class molecular chaperone